VCLDDCIEVIGDTIANGTVRFVGNVLPVLCLECESSEQYGQNCGESEHETIHRFGVWFK
jgi:hypothetical protein